MCLWFLLRVLSPAFAAGGPGNALSFNGASYVDVQHTNSLNAYPLTVTAWINTFAPAGALVAKAPPFAGDGWRLSLNSGQLQGAYGTSVNPAGILVVGNSLLFPGQWHHVAFTVDASGGRLYLDGVLQAFQAWNGLAGPTTSLNDLSLGAYSGGAAFYSGLMDEVTVWNVALTPAQIQNNMNRSLLGNEPGLVAYYRCDERFGPFVGDSAPAGGINDGTWIGGAIFVPSGVQPFTPYAETLLATTVLGSTATLQGVANPEGTNTSAWFEWGTNTSFGSTTPPEVILGGTNNISFAQVLNGLRGNTTYFFHAVASNQFGMVFGTNQTFTTFSLPVVVISQIYGSGGNSGATFGNDFVELYNRSAGPVSLSGWSVQYASGTGTSWSVTLLNGVVPPYSYYLVSEGSGGAVGAALPPADAAGGTDLSEVSGKLALCSTTNSLTGNPPSLGGSILDFVGYGTSANQREGSTTADNAPAPSSTTSLFRAAGGCQDLDNNAADFRAAAVSPRNSSSVPNGCSALNAAPSAGTLPASPVDRFSATLNSSVNPNNLPATGWFEWGTTSSLGSSTVPQALGSGAIATNFSQTLTGLTGSTTYFFRVGVSNSLGTVAGTNQSFTTLSVFDLAVTNLTGVNSGAAAWGDYDNDGRLDILLSGHTTAPAPSSTTQLWRNTGTGFSNINLALPALYFSSLAWGDYNNDGYLDFVLIGFGTNGPFSGIWNLQSGQLNLPGLPGYDTGSVAWGDFDNDGKLDLLLAGNGLNNDAALLWRNAGVSFFDSNAGLPSAGLGVVAVGDYDNDGRLDILLEMPDACHLLRNTGSGFVDMNVAISGLYFGSVAWGDFDNDGRLDLLLTGVGTNTVPVTQVWRNTGNGFTNINAGLPGLREGSAVWGDYDNDGRLDILLTGLDTNEVPVAQIWRNTGSGFVDIHAGLTPVRSSSAAWGDYDNDGRLDVLLSGSATNNLYTPVPVTQVWRNFTLVTNTPPTAPTGLTATLAGSNGVTFSWGPASDAQTPASGLSYNLRVGTSPGAGDLVSPMAASNGFRRVPQLGNAQMNLFRTVKGLPMGQPIYWSVQAVDSAFAGGPFAPEQTLTFNSVLINIKGS